MHLHIVTIHAMPSAQAVPLAAASIKAFLDARKPLTEKQSVTMSEFYSGTPLDQICSEVMSCDADLVGFPVYVWNRLEICSLVKLLRQRAPKVLICAGGPEVTAAPAGILSDAPFDFVVVGEGEATMASVLDCLENGGSVADIQGVATLKCGELKLQKRPPITDIGILPSPYLSGLLDSHISNGVVWPLSRGCPFGCTFCFDGMGDRKVRRYPMDRLEAELDYVVQRNAAQIFVLDSTFNHDVSRAKQILRLVKRKARTVHFHFEVRHELLDAEQARLFAGLTCSLQIGLQSADPAVAKNVGRKLDRNDFARKVMMLNSAGATFGFDLIYGLPGDTLSRFREGLDFAISLYPNHLDIFPLSVLPGTEVAFSADKTGLDHLKSPPYTLLSSPEFPSLDMSEARRLGVASDIFYSRGKAVAWFNAVLAALKLKPVELLQAFSDWLIEKMGREFDEAEFSDHTIWQLQREFLTSLFMIRKKQRLLPLGLDCVDYHYYYAACVMAVAPFCPTARNLAKMDLLKLPLKLGSSANLAIFRYEVTDLLEWGEPDLPAMYGSLEPKGSFVVIYPADGEVRTESIDESYYRLLKGLDGNIDAGSLAADCGLNSSQTVEFLRFALSEGILVIPKMENSRKQPGFNRDVIAEKTRRSLKPNKTGILQKIS